MNKNLAFFLLGFTAALVMIPSPVWLCAIIGGACGVVCAHFENEK